MNNLIRYSFNIEPLQMTGENIKNTENMNHLQFIQKIANIEDSNTLIKLASEYSKVWSEFPSEKRMENITQLLDEMTQNNQVQQISFVTKGLLFWEDNIQNLERCILENAIITGPNDENINDLVEEMSELEKNDDIMFNNEKMQRRSEIQEKLMEFQERVNGRIQSMIKDNYMSEATLMN